MLATQLLRERSCDRCTAHQKIMWGCEQDSQIPLVFDGETVWRCPRRPLLDHPQLFSELFWFYKNLEKGLTPEPGGLLDQPSTLVQAFMIIDAAMGEAQEETLRKMEQGNRSGTWQGSPKSRST